MVLPRFGRMLFADSRAGVATDASLPQFVKNGFDVFLKCGIRAHGFLAARPDFAEVEALSYVVIRRISSRSPEPSYRAFGRSFQTACLTCESRRPV